MKRKRRSWKGLLLLALLLCGILVGWKCLAPVQKPVTLASVKAQQTKTAVKELKDVELASHFALLVRLRDGEVLLDRGASSTIYPASLTKIMTAVVALEHLKDFNQTVTLPVDIFQQLKSTGASVAGFQPGESVPVRDLLYGLLLPSGADAALALAQAVCGGSRSLYSL